MIVSSCPFRIFLSVGLLCSSLSVGEGLKGQSSATLTADENFRAQPNGTVLGQLRAGLSVAVIEATDDWLQFNLEGWVYNPSLRLVDRGNFGLVVSSEGGENLRGRPNGELLGHLEDGTLLELLERESQWSLVRRRAWVWRRSTALFASELVTVPEERSSLSASSGATPDEEWAIGGSVDAPILSVPDGDTLAVSAPNTNLRVLARDGNWARVRLEGWMWLPESADGGVEAAILTGVTLEELAAAPDDYRGEVLQMDLQFISLERAEEIRTDFYATEPFLLTRIGNGGEGFVYVAIPPERLGESQGLSPLERIRVVGRVRTGATRLTGSPILELLSLDRIR